MAFIRLFERFSDPAPTLEGRPWEEVRAEFQGWAEKVVSILDSLSRVSIEDSAVAPIPGGGGVPPPVVIVPSSDTTYYRHFLLGGM